MTPVSLKLGVVVMSNWQSFRRAADKCLPRREAAARSRQSHLLPSSILDLLVSKRAQDARFEIKRLLPV